MYVTIFSERSAKSCAPRVLEAPSKLPPVRLKAGRYLYHEGDEVQRIYRIGSGVVRLTRLLEDGRRQVISFGYPGDVVGFPAGGVHHTDCDVLVDTKLQPYRLTALRDGDGDPVLHQALLSSALNEISAMQDHFMMLGRKSAAERVASFLFVITERFGEDREGGRQITLPMCRSDIADFLGLTTETVSRSFTALRKSGVIALDGIQTVIVLDPKALQALSDGYAS